MLLSQFTHSQAFILCQPWEYLECSQFYFIYLFVCLLLFMAALAACGGSQARGLIEATAASLRHSHSNAKILNPLREPRDQTHVLMDASQIR